MGRAPIEERRTEKRKGAAKKAREILKRFIRLAAKVFKIYNEWCGQSPFSLKEKKRPETDKILRQTVMIPCIVK